MGAWIETKVVLITLLINLVAPYMGAWIETSPIMVNRMNR